MNQDINDNENIDNIEDVNEENLNNINGLEIGGNNDDLEYENQPLEANDELNQKEELYQNQNYNDINELEVDLVDNNNIEFNNDINNDEEQFDNNNPNLDDN